MSNFCWSCGRLADESNLCQNTQCKNGGKDCTPNYLEGRLSDGIVKNKNWLERKIRDDYVTQYYACHNCKYLMWHHLKWCPKCGGKFTELRTTHKEMGEKYADYRTGY